MTFRDKLFGKDNHKLFTLCEKVIIGALVSVGIIGLVNSGKTYNTGCEVYQGHIERRYFIFSKQPLEKIAENELTYSLLEKIEMHKDLENGLIYSLLGNPEMSGGLNPGDKYRLEIRKPTLASLPKKLLDFKKCD